MNLGGKQLAIIILLMVASMVLWGMALEPASAQEVTNDEMETLDDHEKEADNIIDTLEVELQPPDEIGYGEEMSLSASVPTPCGTFVGCPTWSFEMDLYVDGNVESTMSVEVDGGDTAEIELSHTFGQVGCSDVQTEFELDYSHSVRPDFTVSGTVPAQPVNVCVEPPEMDFGFDFDIPDNIVAGEDISFEAVAPVPEIPGPQTHSGELNFNLLVDGEQSTMATAEVAEGETAEITLDHTFNEVGCVDLQIKGELQFENLPAVETTVPSEPVDTCIDIPDIIRDFEITPDVDIPEQAVTGENLTISMEANAPEFPIDLGLEEYIDIKLLMNGEQVEGKNILISNGESVGIEFQHIFEEDGELTLEVVGELTMANQTFEAGFNATIDVLELKEVDGASFILPKSLQDDLDEYRNNFLTDTVLEELPVDFPVINAFVAADEQELYVVFTDEEPKKGAVEAQGIVRSKVFDVIEDQTEFEFKVMLATNVSFTQTGEPTTVSSVKNNPEDYRLELVRIDAAHRSTAVRTDIPETPLSYQSTAGFLVDNPWEPGDIMSDLGLYAQRRMIGDESVTIREVFDGISRERLPTYSSQESFWIDGKATVDGILLAPGSRAKEFVTSFVDREETQFNPSQPLLSIVQENFNPDKYEDVSTLVQETENGDIIRLDARLHQLTISWKETILELAPPCGDGEGTGEDTVYIQTPQGPVCVPLVFDVLMHGGIAWSEVPQVAPPGDLRDDFVLVIGASSWEQDKPVQPRQGEYEIIGEVVSSERVHESLPEGKVILAYDMDKHGSVDFDEIAQEIKENIEERAEQIRDIFKAQLDIPDRDRLLDIKNIEIGNVSSGETIDITPDVEEGIGINRISLSANEDLVEVDLTVANRIELPSNISEPPDDSIKKFDISTTASADEIANTAIEFSLDTQEVPESGEIVAYRYHENTWVELETTVIEETSAEIIVEAETDGFSIFSVTVDEAGEENDSTDDQEDDSTDDQEDDSTDDQEDDSTDDQEDDSTDDQEDDSTDDQEDDSTDDQEDDSTNDQEDDPADGDPVEDDPVDDEQADDEPVSNDSTDEEPADGGDGSADDGGTGFTIAMILSAISLVVFWQLLTRADS